MASRGARASRARFRENRRMRSRSVSALRALLVALLSATSLAAIAADPARPLAPIGPDDLVFERTQNDWSEAYLQWIAAFPRDASPVSDATGALCAAKQDGDVWFL